MTRIARVGSRGCCLCVCVLLSHSFRTSDLWTHQPGSHRKKVTGFLHLPLAVLALVFLAGRIQPVPFPRRPWSRKQLINTYRTHAQKKNTQRRKETYGTMAPLITWSNRTFLCWSAMAARFSWCMRRSASLLSADAVTWASRTSRSPASEQTVE